MESGKGFARALISWISSRTRPAVRRCMARCCLRMPWLALALGRVRWTMKATAAQQALNLPYPVPLLSSHSDAYLAFLAPATAPLVFSLSDSGPRTRREAQGQWRGTAGGSTRPLTLSICMPCSWWSLERGQTPRVCARPTLVFISCPTPPRGPQRGTSIARNDPSRETFFSTGVLSR
ncbi:hypothetical protein FKP32DRAFT_78292 [Trametes sanguinea]|nr:hypothetical protein FKP32DRAFT_78292 [Trametes sanguinea]